jgi:hypothetical protein
MLFAEETPLTASVQGAPAFVQGFTAQGPKDGRGRSLRDFDLQTRIFKYPCSYLIYSPAFDALPEEARMKIYRRIYDVLRSKEDMPGYERLSADTRQAIFEILRETKPGLPDYWKREGETKAQQRSG